MPLYEYKCQECEEVFTELRSLGNESEVPCQKCGSKNTRKLVTSFASFSAKSSHTCSTGGG